MLIKSVQCKKCKLYYNAAAEDSCPWCKGSGETEDFFDGYDNNNEEKNSESIDDMNNDCEKVYEENGEQQGESEHKEKGFSYDYTDQNNKGSNGESLRDMLMNSGKTKGMFFSNTNETIEPVMGWLVCVKGVYFGEAFKIKNGKNKIGRSVEMDINLEKDTSVSRTCMANIIYDMKGNKFSILPGESSSLCYVNNEALYERVALKGYEEIEFGDTEQNKFVFIPLCGEQFHWSKYEVK